MSDSEELPKIETTVEVPREVPLKHIIPKDLPLLYADNLVVKNQEGMFLLYFFQAQQPLSFTKEELDKVQEVEMQCVARLIITPSQFKKNLDAMQSNFQTFIGKFIGDDSGSKE